jgi:ribose transport system permease protein
MSGVEQRAASKDEQAPSKPDDRTVPFHRRAWGNTQEFRPVLVLLSALIIFLSATQSDFLTYSNIKVALTSVAGIWVIAMGMTLVLLSGGFDLSVGAVAALAAYVMAKLLAAGVPGAATFVITIAIGAAVGGAINGLLVGRLRLNVFVVTLASATTLTGILSLWSHTDSIFLTGPLPAQLAIDKLAGVPTPIWIMALTFAGALYVQTRTYFGRDVYATGGSRNAARLSGIRTTMTLVAVYATVAACAALAGMIDAGQAGAATPQVDNTLPLTAIAAVLLGGTALTGGVGGVGGTALGVLFLAVLQNGLSIAGVQSYWQQVLTGIILVAAVLGGRGEVRSGLAAFLGRRRVRRDNRPAESVDASPRHPATKGKE